MFVFVWLQDRVTKRSTSPLDSEGNSVGSSESDYSSQVSDFDSISPVDTYQYRSFKPAKRERGK